MPFKNPEDKKAWQARWKEKSNAEGYNLALYRQRQVVRENERLLRATVEEALDALIYGSRPDGKERVWGRHKVPRSEEAERIDEALRVLRAGLRRAQPVKGPRAYLPQKRGGVGDGQSGEELPQDGGGPDQS